MIITLRSRDWIIRPFLFRYSTRLCERAAVIGSRYRAIVPGAQTLLDRTPP